MRVYKSDGSFVEDNDTEFGWYFYEIVIDESNDRFEEINQETRFMSKLKKTFSQTYESMDLINLEDLKNAVSPDVENEKIFDVAPCIIQENYSTIAVDLEFPSKDKLAEMINPCNIETRALLSVINYPKYISLFKEESTSKLMMNVNMKSTNFNHLIKDTRSSLSDDMAQEIAHYHATKEDNMMSLMMELILTDVDCIVEDVSTSEHENEAENVPQIPQFVFETSDLGNSLPSIGSNRSETIVDSNYLQVSNRANILNSLGLSEEDKSIQSFCNETFEMYHELADIKRSFQEDANKVNDLLKQACALKNDLRETLYLNDIINLLEGDIEKVKLKKLPFRIFCRAIGDRDTNLIV